jgi:glycogen synthase kinase 3 beta
MDLYDCDLNDYIMTKMKIDNLTLKIFCYQMIRSLLYLHSHQICHRDIKPNNFLVKKHLVVLTDFGSAKIMKNHKNSNVAYICSRYYRAPELTLGYKYYDKPVDIWSLGCVMAELSLGKPIFKGSNSLDQLVRIIRVIGQPNWRKISFMVDKIPNLP